MACARSTASASELRDFAGHGAVPILRRSVSAISPIRIVDRTFSVTSGRSVSNVNPLSFPPAIRITGLALAQQRLFNRIEIGRL